jgi:hypothetical protein
VLTIAFKVDCFKADCYKTDCYKAVVRLARGALAFRRLGLRSGA